MRMVILKSLTLADIEALAEHAPMDSVQTWLLRHQRCVIGRADALALEPPAVPSGVFVGTCRHCGGVEMLPGAIVAGLDYDGLDSYCTVLAAAVALAGESDALFVRPDSPGAGGERFRKCFEAMRDTIVYGVMLSYAQPIAH